MVTFFNTLLNILLPKRESFIRLNKLKILPTSSLQIVLDELVVYYLSDFKNPNVRAVIHEAKFHDTAKAHRLLAQALTIYLQRTNTSVDVIIPLPLSKARRKKRGFNQVERILDQAGVQFDSSILTRGDRPNQTSLTREERLQNVRGAFSIAIEKAPRITGKHILLVDDVVTTGATLQAAQAALVPHHPASITCLALAH